MRRYTKAMLWSVYAATFVSTALCAGSVIPLRVRKSEQQLSPESSLYRRSDGYNSVLEKMHNKRTFYEGEVEIGTPPQKITLLLDTGSSDTWVLTAQTQFSGGLFGSKKAPKGSTLFDPNASSTFRPNNTQFVIQYGIGSASGEWGTDAFRIGGAQLQSLSIALATKVSSISEGIIGLGRPQAEVTIKQGVSYDNLPQRLKREGLIASAAYSLYMDDLNAREGTILFGGVDHSRYTGELAVLPVTHPRQLGVQLFGMHGDRRSKNNLLSRAQTCVLDSGTTLTYVDKETLLNIQGALNSNPSFAINMKYYCDCNITNHMVLDFGGTMISVPSYNFLWPIETIVDPIIASIAFPQNSCYLGIEQVQDGMDFVLMGDNMLRSMYIVYDLDNKQIALANAAPDYGQPNNIEAITPNRIPGVKYKK